ncbi:MAG: hypothetical protein BAJATHORv1_70119 [Candidatus Thorarchaeota archaeon]|nr:MAG: hypothetical protein BAJATHORv1_70119 [Candidatus Thorarchaeota archaeon]
MSQDKFEADCMVCGKVLVYGKDPKLQKCLYCGSETESGIYCPEGHFVCDVCHAVDGLDYLKNLAETETSTDPLEIAKKAMNHPSFSFHGPEHHSLVPAAILIALKNREISHPDGEPISIKDIKTAIARGSHIPGGFCGYAGNCGGCVGSGIAVAQYLGSTPRKGKERTLAHKATHRALELVQDEMIRCCKRSVYYGLVAGIDMFREEFGIDLGPTPDAGFCEFYDKNPDCVGLDCLFFP